MTSREFMREKFGDEVQAIRIDKIGIPPNEDIVYFHTKKGLVIGLDYTEGDGFEIFLPATSKNNVPTTEKVVRAFLEG